MSQRPSESIEAILAKPRWANLRRFVEDWYVEPLGAEGASVDELAAAESRLEAQLPEALWEWYRLVDHRLTPVNQDRLMTLGDLAVSEEGVVVCEECQNVWEIRIALGRADDDPWVMVAGQTARAVHERTSGALHGMLVSNTLIGALGGTGIGPLGALKPTVVGGCAELEPEREQHLQAAWPSLNIFSNPFYRQQPFGHKDLVVRSEDCLATWMVSTPEALREMRQTLAISDDEPKILMLVFRPRRLWQSWFLRLAAQGDDLPPGWQAPGDHLLSKQWSFNSKAPVIFELQTHHPRKSFAVLQSKLKFGLANTLEAGFRPESCSSYEPLWPPELARFVAPR